MIKRLVNKDNMGHDAIEVGQPFHGAIISSIEKELHTNPGGISFAMYVIKAQYHASVNAIYYLDPLLWEEEEE